MFLQMLSADGCSWSGLVQRCEPQALLLNPTLGYQRSEQFPWDTEGIIVSARGSIKPCGEVMSWTGACLEGHEDAVIPGFLCHTVRP